MWCREVGVAASDPAHTTTSSTTPLTTGPTGTQYLVYLNYCLDAVKHWLPEFFELRLWYFS